MSNSSILLPTSPVLSTDSAIESILSDIPLFCEGIMGIGVFTFLFLTKQVKLLAVFLYASSFVAFAAATLDLGQVLARGPQHAADEISLSSISGFVYAREVFLAMSFFFLDLFFWTLVSQCPRRERTETNDLSTRRRLPSTHSASWNRWGLMGTFLKWGTLAALLSVPLLQFLWRLIPAQRKYGSIYVAESTIQTSVTAIFILKLLLNVYISPLSPWLRALKAYAVPITALCIGTALGVGNLTVFAFTETALGRFLRAVEVYLLILHSLFTTFQDFSIRPQTLGNNSSQEKEPEKSQYIGTLPSMYPIATKEYGASLLPSSRPKFIPKTQVSPRLSTPSWLLNPPPRKISSDASPQVEGRNVTIASSPSPPSGNVYQLTEPQEGDPRERSEIPRAQSRPPSREHAERDSVASERPLTSVSLSYYTMEPSFPQARTQDQVESSNSILKPPSVGSQQASITSIDELLRQQSELDKSIAALRLVSMSMASIPRHADKQSTGGETSATQPSRSRSTLISSKTESLSNRSDFSLSIFPDPPIAPKEEVATKYPVDAIRKSESQVFTIRESAKNDVPAPAPAFEDRIPLSSTIQGPQPRPGSPPARYDVTSFIGDLSEPMVSSERFTSRAEETFELAASSPNNGLRPMFLPSMLSTSPEVSVPLSPVAAPYDGERTRSISPTDATKSLRPLLLGMPSSSRVISQQLSVTMVPLAQRRQRGGTISSNTRRPVIGMPRLNEDRTEDDVRAFERPRPPPLRSNERTNPV